MPSIYNISPVAAGAVRPVSEAQAPEQVVLQTLALRLPPGAVVNPAVTPGADMGESELPQWLRVEREEAERRHQQQLPVPEEEAEAPAAPPSPGGTFPPNDPGLRGPDIAGALDRMAEQDEQHLVASFEQAAEEAEQLETDRQEETGAFAAFAAALQAQSFARTGLARSPAGARLSRREIEQALLAAVPEQARFATVERRALALAWPLSMRETAMFLRQNKPDAEDALLWLLHRPQAQTEWTAGEFTGLVERIIDQARWI